MNELRSHAVQCPYCGETFVALIDCSVPRQSYVEDCEVCCRPIDFTVTVSSDDIAVLTAREDE